LHRFLGCDRTEPCEFERCPEATVSIERGGVCIRNACRLTLAARGERIAKKPRKLTGATDGDRQFVGILAAVLTDGLGAFEAACLEAIASGVHSADVILNILASVGNRRPS
jgi:hypothetical protein